MALDSNWNRGLRYICPYLIKWGCLMNRELWKLYLRTDRMFYGTFHILELSFCSRGVLIHGTFHKTSYLWRQDSKLNNTFKKWFLQKIHFYCKLLQRGKSLGICPLTRMRTLLKHAKDLKVFFEECPEVESCIAEFLWNTNWGSSVGTVVA